MEEIPIAGQDDANRLFKQFMSQYGAPAYIRRARGVQEALDELLGRCRREREERVRLARMRLGILRALAGEWDRLRPLLADDDQLNVLAALQDTLKPRLLVAVEPTMAPRILRRALRELVESLERFNWRWQTFLAGVDLSPINALRDGYNHYFVMEKECAVRSPRLAREGFVKLPPLTVDDLTLMLPLLPVPLLFGRHPEQQIAHR